MAEDDRIAERIGAALTARGETLAVAESCTGGLVGSRITAVPGASEYFVGGVISYVDRTKRQVLAISRESLDRHGPVSEPVAREMAQHVRDETGADWGVSTTCYAGPEGGSSDEPVGTVYVGIAAAGASAADTGDDDAGPRDDDAGPGDDDAGPGADGPSVSVERHQFDGTRREVREAVTAQALASTLDAIDERR